MPAVLKQNAFDGMVNRLNMLLDIPIPMNYVTIDQLTLNLIDISLDNKPQIFCKFLVCLAKIGKIDCSKITKLWLVTFCIFNLKIAYLSQF